MVDYTAIELLRLAAKEPKGSLNQRNLLIMAMARQMDEDYDAESKDREAKGLSPLKPRQIKESEEAFKTSHVYDKYPHRRRSCCSIG